MDIYAAYLPLALIALLFATSKKYQYWLFLIIVLGVIAATSRLAIMAFQAGEALEIPLFDLAGRPIALVIDKLSAFFIVAVNLTVLTGAIYARSYLKPYLERTPMARLAWHYFNFFWLYASMLLVVMLRDAMAFLIAWELMSLSSFFLVMFDSDKKETVAIGIKYLIQMHIGFVFILVAFLVATGQGAQGFSFDGLSGYFQRFSPNGVFILFFIGFGIKAGFIPLHTWLPHAHPAAPSHVSGIMSGIMLKMGIYGILRVLSYIHSDLLFIGIFVLVVSMISGVLGVTIAIVQHDLKKLLAYHSIENIGIIGIGIGLGIIGMATGNSALAALGLAGGILHVLNHSLFKSLLFYTAGNVYQQTHTRNIEQLGGLSRQMPRTAMLFLIGSLAICGLPPFNGFISEFLIYSASFESMASGDMATNMTLLFSIIGLALIGGLAIFCFTKVFSVVFLGAPRSQAAAVADETSLAMNLPSYAIAVLIIAIGILPWLLLPALSGIVGIYGVQTDAISQLAPSMINIGMISAIFVAAIGLLWLARARQQSRKVISLGDTWACGYTGANAARHQYTATSYADSLAQLARQAVNIKKHFQEYGSNEIFPGRRSFGTHSSDIFEAKLITPPSEAIIKIMEKAAVFQTGNIQHYLLYALVFAMVIFLLTLFNVI